jgi:predicted HD phosphohydrolase
MTDTTEAAPTTQFTAMASSTAEEWGIIGTEHVKDWPRTAETVLEMLRRLGDLQLGFATTQLVHSLQTAARAEAAGKDDEVVVAALCHDIGKFVTVANHPAIAAEILKNYVREDVYWMIRAHQDFQGRHYYEHFKRDPNARDQYRDEPWYDLAEWFADECDQNSFDPEGPIPPLEHFEPLVRKVFAAPRSM